MMNINDIATQALKIISPQPDKPPQKSITLKVVDWLAELTGFAGEKQALCALLWALVVRNKDNSTAMTGDDADLMEEIAKLIFALENISAGTDVVDLYEMLTGQTGGELVVEGERSNGTSRFSIRIDPSPGMPTVSGVFNEEADQWEVTS